MLVEVDLPIPVGYELSEKMMRLPKGEPCIDQWGTFYPGGDCCENCWILRKVWTYPEWLGGECVLFSQACGKWFLVSGVKDIALDSDRFPLWIEPPDRTKKYLNPKCKEA